MGLLIAMTMAFIFSYVWGYVGAIGLMMRNQFHLPFIAAGLLTLPVWLLFQSGKPRPRGLNLTLGGLALGLAVLSLTGIYLLTPRPAVTTSRDRTLTVVAFNMQQGSKIGGNHNYREQLDLLRKLNADIVTLQENDTARPSGGNADATRYFAEGLGYHAYYGPNGVSGTYGTAILSRFPLENPRTFFTYSDDDENATAVAEVVVNGRRIAIFSNHPSGSPPTRVAHARALVDEAAKYPLVIAAGDFNFEQTDPWYATVTEKLKDSWRSLYPDGIGKPHPSIRQPNAGATLDMRDRIDHIFVSPQIDVLESYYLPPPESETDHPIHWSVLKIK
jgi:endonuclease/exonuclease/phosphatase family metal-dependent hydrolase